MILRQNAVRLPALSGTAAADRHCQTLLHCPDILFGYNPIGAFHSIPTVETLEILEEANRKGTTLPLVI